MATYVIRKKEISFGDQGVPFQIFVRKNPDDEKLYEYKINKYSTFNFSIRPDDLVEITGLDEWKDLNIKDDDIWIEYSYEDNSAEIKSKGNGDNWADWEEFVEMAGDGVQPLNCKILIGYFRFVNEKQLFRQVLRNNLLMREIAYKGIIVLYPWIYHGGYKLWT